MKRSQHYSISHEKCAFLIGFDVAKIRSLQGPQYSGVANPLPNAVLGKGSGYARLGPQLTVCWLTLFKSSPPTTGPIGVEDIPYNCDISTIMR